MLGPILLFFGYLLVYAGVAHGGVFATDPWNGIFSDAYTDVTLGGATTSGSSPASGPNPPASGGTPGGQPQQPNIASRSRIRPINNPAGGIGGASNSNFTNGGLTPGSLTGPTLPNPNSGGLLGAPPNFQIG